MKNCNTNNNNECEVLKSIICHKASVLFEVLDFDEETGQITIKATLKIDDEIIQSKTIQLDTIGPVGEVKTYNFMNIEGYSINIRTEQYNALDYAISIFIEKDGELIFIDQFGGFTFWRAHKIAGLLPGINEGYVFDTWCEEITIDIRKCIEKYLKEYIDCFCKKRVDKFFSNTKEDLEYLRHHSIGNIEYQKDRKVDRAESMAIINSMRSRRDD